MRVLAAVLSISLILAQAFSQDRPPQASAQNGNKDSGTDVQLRGISAVSDQVAWASGAKGTVLRTIDGGATWDKVSVPAAAVLDFRDVQAFDQNTAFVLSIGPGDQSRIYKTADGGKTWQLQFNNKDPKAFYDCFAFWDGTHGIALSDSVDGKFPLIATSDGLNWRAVAVKNMPAALPNEGAFAASGACIATFGKKDVWFATGGPAARVFHSADRGASWTVAGTPILHGEASQGIFSVLFWSEKDGVVVGGDYKEPAKGEKSAAYTHDGGKTWTAASLPPQGYLSAVARISSTSTLMAVGTSGQENSNDGGKTWRHSGSEDLNALSVSKNVAYAVGPNGKIRPIYLNFRR